MTKNPSKDSHADAISGLSGDTVKMTMSPEPVVEEVPLAKVYAKLRLGFRVLLDDKSDDVLIKMAHDDPKDGVHTALVHLSAVHEYLSLGWRVPSDAELATPQYKELEKASEEVAKANAKAAEDAAKAQAEQDAAFKERTATIAAVMAAPAPVANAQ